MTELEIELELGANNNFGTICPKTGIKIAKKTMQIAITFKPRHLLGGGVLLYLVSSFIMKLILLLKDYVCDGSMSYEQVQRLSDEKFGRIMVCIKQFKQKS